MKNFVKKLITLTYLIIFLFGLFAPFNKSLAQTLLTKSLTISASPGVINSTDYSTITATVDESSVALYTQATNTITFSSSPAVSGFNGVAKCDTNKTFFSSASWTCTVQFNSSAKGIYTINASFTDTDGKNYSAQAIKIETCGSSETINQGFCVASTPVTLPPGDNAASTSKTDTTYTPLAPLPGLGLDANSNPTNKPIDTLYNKDTNPCPFGNYLNTMIKIVLGFAAVLAMIMIVMGGVEYMTTELVSSKEAGKERIEHAIFGLIIALGAFTILNTINPDLLSTCLNTLPQASITVLPFDADTNSYVTKTDSVNCQIKTSGDCTPDNLKNYFGDKNESASKICNVESGGRANLKSGGDYCTNSDNNKTTFSFGLFQINLIANGDKIPNSVGSCANLFTTDDGKEIGYGKSGYIVTENGNFKYYNCKLKPDRGADYTACSSYLMTAAGNLDMAKKLFNNRGNTFGDWKPSDSKVCPSAFQ